MPSDVTGTSIFDRNTNDFVLRKGPIFTQVLLADEINRAPAKTQAALLEAMQEYQVTVDGASLPLTLPFLVLATQNPVEQEGVYRLPEAQLDRFLLRVEMGYPGFDHEVNLLRMHSKPAVEIEPDVQPRDHPVASAEAPRRLWQRVAVPLHRATGRGEPAAPGCVARGQPAGGAEPAQVCPRRAVLEGRHFFTHEDVQAVAFGVLGHRLILRPEAEIEGKHVSDVVRDVLQSVPVFETV